MAPPTDPWYTPPNFSVYEFDDSRLSALEREAGTRWLSGFNGRIGHPAQDVQLSWRTKGGAQVMVCTGGADSIEALGASLRFTAVTRLDGAQFYDPGPPLKPPLPSMVEVQRYVDDSASWHPRTVMIDQEPARAEVTEIAGYQVGYVVVEAVVVCFVHRGLDDDWLALRRLPRPTDGYRINPAAPQALAELRREWDEFLRDRPDLDSHRVP